MNALVVMTAFWAGVGQADRLPRPAYTVEVTATKARPGGGQRQVLAFDGQATGGYPVEIRAGGELDIRGPVGGTTKQWVGSTLRFVLTRLPDGRVNVEGWLDVSEARPYQVTVSRTGWSSGPAVRTSGSRFSAIVTCGQELRLDWPGDFGTLRLTVREETE